MRRTRTALGRRRAGGLAGLLCLGAGLGAAGCGSPGSNLAVALPPVHARSLATEVALDVGRLLSADGPTSRAAEERLLALDEEGRAALAEHARQVPGERDPRWLNVLFRHRLLPPLDPTEELGFLLWKAEREPEGPAARAVEAMAAQQALVGLARRAPEPLLAHLAAAGPGWERVALALAEARAPGAARALVARYRGAPSAAARGVLAEALALLLGPGQRPRATGSDAEVAAEAERLEAWVRELETPAEPPATPPAEGGGDA